MPDKKPRSAMEYLKELYPGRFDEGNCPRVQPEWINRCMGLAAGSNGKGIESLTSEGEIPNYCDDVVVVARDTDLTASQLRAIPRFDFDIAQVMAIQLVIQESYDEGIGCEIGRRVIQGMVREDRRFKNLTFPIGLFDGLYNPGGINNWVYQIIAFPTTKEHVEGLGDIVGELYGNFGKRMKAFKKLRRQGGREFKSCIFEEIRIREIFRRLGRWIL